MKERIIATQEYMPYIYHSEDGELRDGGVIPEYAHTMMICVDSYRDGMAFGRIHTYLFEEEFHFCTLDQILFGIEDILERAHIVERDTAMRKELMTLENIAVGKENQEAFEEFINDVAKTREKPFYPRGGLSVKCGAVANFHIRVIARRHSSLQGTISQWGQDVLKTAPFRSALELLYLLSSTLEKCEAAE